jgi:hypothetical protein
VKLSRLIHCLKSIVGLLVANYYQTNHDGDNNIVPIRLESSGVIFLPRGHYRNNNGTSDAMDSVLQKSRSL